MSQNNNHEIKEKNLFGRVCVKEIKKTKIKILKEKKFSEIILIIRKTTKVQRHNTNMFMEQQRMEVKYNNFYPHSEILESQDANSNLDDLDSIFNDRVDEGQYNVYCFSDCGNNYYKRNLRVSDIPVGCLVACIKTEHLPELQFWTKSNNSKKHKSKKIENLNKKNMGNRVEQSQWKIFDNTCESFIQPQKQSQNQHQHQKYPQIESFKFLSKDQRKVSETQSQQTKWKTDLAILNKQKFQDRNNNKEIMRTCYQTKQINYNSMPSDIDTSRKDSNAYMNFMNIFKKNELSYDMRALEETSEKGSISCSSSLGSLSIKNDNLRMINERIFEINQNQRKNEQTSYGINKTYGKRIRTQDLYEQPSKTKYTKKDIIFQDLKKQQFNINMEMKLFNH